MESSQSPDVQTVGVLIRDRRKAMKLSQADLAFAAGVGRRFVIELENGGLGCRLGKVLQVMRALGITWTTVEQARGRHP